MEAQAFTAVRLHRRDSRCISVAIAVLRGEAADGSHDDWHEKDTRPMFAAKTMNHTDKTEFYRELCAQLSGLLADENDAIANAAKTSA
ncbi:MAG: hypothetical protein J0I92_09335, partial [Phyllobacterium sp.]|nr:hypothetical protein [Phyllobacterium sp.]